MMRPCVLTIFVLLVTASLCHGQQAVFIVRHAEKADNSPDPPLSSKGKARAVELAKLLRNANIAAVYSSEFQRTVKTAEPLAQQLTLEIKKEFTGSADDFAKLLAARHANDTVLVVGHSNIVPALLKSLGFSPSPPILTPLQTGTRAGGRGGEGQSTAGSARGLVVQARFLLSRRVPAARA